MAKLRKKDEKQLLNQLGSRIRELRSEAEATQEEMAARAGIDYKRYQRIEGGHVNVTVRTLMRIARALDVTFWQVAQEPETRPAKRRR